MAIPEMPSPELGGTTERPQIRHPDSGDSRERPALLTSLAALVILASCAGQPEPQAPTLLECDCHEAEPMLQALIEYGRDDLCKTLVDGNPIMRDSLENEWCQ